MQIKLDTTNNVFPDLDLTPFRSKPGVGAKPLPTPEPTSTAKPVAVGLASMTLTLVPEAEGRKARAKFTIVTAGADTKQKSLITISPDHAIKWLLRLSDTAENTLLRAAVNNFAAELRLKL